MQTTGQAFLTGAFSFRLTAGALRYGAHGMYSGCLGMDNALRLDDWGGLVSALCCLYSWWYMACVYML